MADKDRRAWAQKLTVPNAKQPRRFAAYIGIDPGVQTGLAIWIPPAPGAPGRYETIETTKIHRAMATITEKQLWACTDGGIYIRMEDARLRVWFGDADQRQAQRGAGIREGIGSVKRDCGIWEDFMTDAGIPHDLVKPAAGTTKWSAEYFTKVTGWTKRTSEHARDAAALVFNLSTVLASTQTKQQ